MHILHASFTFARWYHEIFFAFLYVVVTMKTYPALAIHLPLNQWLNEISWFHRIFFIQLLLMRLLDSFDSEYESTNSHHVFFIYEELLCRGYPHGRQWNDLKLIELRSCYCEQLLYLLLIFELTQWVLIIYRLVF